MATRDWRSSDRAGRHGPEARSVTEVVLRIQRTLSIACLAEAALLFVAAGALTLAAVARAGVSPTHAAACLLAVLSGSCAAACWVREHHQSPAWIARSLDKRMRHQGSLVSAYEVEAERVPSAMGRLLVARVLERLRLREALRAMFPPLLIPIAAPLLGLGLFGLSLEAKREEAQATADLSALTEGMLGALVGFDQATLEAGEEDQIKAATLREMLALSDRVKSLQRRSDLLSLDPARALEELDGLALDMADMAALVQHEPKLSEPLEQAGNWMEATRMELRASLDGENQKLGAKPTAAAAGAVTSAAEKGMMSASGIQGSNPGAAGAPEDTSQGTPLAPLPFPSQSGSGALAGDHWPPEYEGVISGWIELQRRAKQTGDR